MEDRMGRAGFFSNGTTQARWVMILVSRNANVNINKNKTKRDDEGRFLAIEMVHGENKITVTNLYAPNEDAPGFFMSKLETIESMGNDLKIVAGDFNLVLDDGKDRTESRRHPHTGSKNLINAYIKAENMTDVWRYFNPEIFRYMWSRQNPSPLAERLDYILISEPLVSLTDQVGIEPSFRSDHGIPWITLLMNQNERGPGFWKLNTSLLKDEIYTTEIRELIREEIEVEGRSASLKWEIKKYLEMKKN